MISRMFGTVFELLDNSYEVFVVFTVDIETDTTICWSESNQLSK